MSLYFYLLSLSLSLYFIYISFSSVFLFTFTSTFSFFVGLLGTMDVNVKLRDRLTEARIILAEYQHNTLGRNFTEKLGF